MTKPKHTSELLEGLEKLMNLIQFADQDFRSLQGDNMQEYLKLKIQLDKSIAKAKGDS